MIRQICLAALALLPGFLYAQDNTEALRHPPLSFPSPDGNWVVKAKWLDAPRGPWDGFYDWWFQSTKSGTEYLKREGTIVADNEIGPRDLHGFWSHDSRFVAVNLPIGSGRFTHDCCVYVIGKSGPTMIRPTPWDDEQNFVPAMLKGPDVKSADGYQRFRVIAEKWINATDLEINCDLQAKLKASKALPEEWALIDAVVTIRFSSTGNARILSGHYDSYEKTAVRPPPRS